MLLKENTKTKIKGAEDIAKIMTAILGVESQVDQDKEHFWVIGLTTRNVVKYIELVSLGSLNQTIANPREVFRTAIMQGVCSIIAVHNHPSEDTKESPEDKIITKQLVEAGKIIGIALLDHIIIGGKNEVFDHNSLKESCSHIFY